MCVLALQQYLFNQWKRFENQTVDDITWPAGGASESSSTGTKVTVNLVRADPAVLTWARATVVNI